MLLKSTSNNEPVFNIVKNSFIDEAINYIKRIIILNSVDTNEQKLKLNMFLNTLEQEFTTQCSIRNFTVLNTNVIEVNFKRILSDSSLINFYFEVYKAFLLNLNLNYSKEDCAAILDTILTVVKTVPCKMSASKDKYNDLYDGDNGFSNLCGNVHIVKTVVDNFLETNPWYFSVIIGNLCAGSVLENIKVLQQAK